MAWERGMEDVQKQMNLQKLICHAKTLTEI
jgi:hypothetical protein